MYSEESYEIIKDRMLNVLDTALDKREGTFINDMYSPIAIEFAKTYIELDTIHSLLFVEDSEGEYLDKRVTEFGIMRKDGERARGIITFEGTDNTLVPRNMEISTDGGFKYLTISQGYIKDGSIDIEVEALEVGELYNIEANSNWELPRNVSVDKLSNVEKFEGGLDVESDGDLKKRFFDAVHNVRTSGNKNNYIYWAKECPGIFNAEVYPLHGGPGTVKVVVSGENRMPVDDEILENCKDIIIENAPIGATPTILTTTIFNIDINLSITIDGEYVEEDIISEVKKSIATYIGSCTDKIYYNKLAAKILSCEGVIDYTNLTVNGSSSNIITIPTDNVAVIDEINITTNVGVANE